MTKQDIYVSVHSVKEIVITQTSYKGGEVREPFKCISIAIRSEGEHEQTLEIHCYTRHQPQLITKLGGPDDLLSRRIEVKYAGP